ncbi:hypothetical protein AaE_015465 [Aphanomyces astaci]|uniref:Chromo domain-containing protein n=1 Tax=Aphanomyces astaci TaxID=112090 RepID=A0A6A4YX61_APHAT|nr:hypothetical protein AaE_015465 [Aphanomyces astaci]
MFAFDNTVIKEVTDIDWLDSTRKKHMEELPEAMEQLHREVAAASAKKRRQARDRQAKSKAVQLHKFAIVDFVLVGSVPLRQEVVPALVRPKQDRPGRDRLSHRDPAVGGHDVTEDLADHIAFGNEVFHVAKLGDVREENGEYQALVNWLGLD